MKAFLIRQLLHLGYGIPAKAESPFDIRSVRKILVIRRNGLGDMICTLPLLRNLRAALPPVQIDLLAGERNACIVENLGIVDQVHLYTRGKGLLRNHYFNLPNVLRPIRKEKYDLLIAVKGGFSPLLAVIAYATRIPWRLGYVPSKGHSMDFCFNLKIELPVEREHQIESCLRFLEPLGIEKKGCDLSIRTEPRHESFGEEIVEKAGVKAGGFVLMNVSSERRESRWSERTILETTEQIQKKWGWPSILCGISRDGELLRKLQKEGGKSIATVCQPSDIHYFAALTKLSRFLICGDGGPMHISAAVGIPVFVLFSATDPRIWRPYHVPFGYLQKGRFVSEISSEEVVEGIEKWLPTWMG